MKILHCNTHDKNGGAAVATRRIHSALLSDGVDSRLGVLRRTQQQTPVTVLSNRWRRLFDPLVQGLEHWPISYLGAKSKAPFSPAFLPSLIHRLINTQDVDIVHLHWIASSFIPSFSLRRITKPVIWTVHDMWPFTGGCHVALGCEQYKDLCAACPQMSYKAQTVIRKSFSAKQKAYRRLRPIMVSPSKAYARCLRKSTLLGTCECHYVPNPIDTAVYKPIDKAVARHALGLPTDCDFLVFGAMSALSDRNKGFDLLVEALDILTRMHTKPVRLLVFGDVAEPTLLAKYAVHSLGRLHDDISLRLAYSAADVFVCPSREESFSLTTLEALACGTPAAAFAVGGIPDMVDHGVNGMLARPHDPIELAQGIAHILSDDARRVRMGQAARQVVEERFAMPIIARQYINLYNEVLEQHRARQS